MKIFTGKETDGKTGYLNYQLIFFPQGTEQEK
jgi:hypothetical protein